MIISYTAEPPIADNYEIIFQWVAAEFGTHDPLGLSALRQQGLFNPAIAWTHITSPVVIGSHPKKQSNSFGPHPTVEVLDGSIMTVIGTEHTKPIDDDEDTIQVSNPTLSVNQSSNFPPTILSTHAAQMGKILLPLLMIDSTMMNWTVIRKSRFLWWQFFTMIQTLFGIFTCWDKSVSQPNKSQGFRRTYLKQPSIRISSPWSTMTMLIVVTSSSTHGSIIYEANWALTLSSFECSMTKSRLPHLTMHHVAKIRLHFY